MNAHSTGLDLYNLVSVALQQPWAAATLAYPLTDDMWTLRDKSDVDIVKAFPDSPAFLHLCMSSGVSGKKHFVGGKTMRATVMLTADAYIQVQNHKEDVESQVC